MRYTVEAKTRGHEYYRLQKDNNWKLLVDKKIKRDDQIFQNLYETQSFVMYEGELKLDSNIYKINPPFLDFTDFSVAFINPSVHREVKPRTFSREELVGVIAAGDDEQHNSLVLTLEGYFKLMETSQAQSKIAPIAVRHETFCAGNDYVGLNASLDKRLIEESYLSSLEGWIIHLATGKLGVYQDYLQGKKREAELWQEVKELTKDLK